MALSTITTALYARKRANQHFSKSAKETPDEVFGVGRGATLQQTALKLLLAFVFGSGSVSFVLADKLKG
jgi:hypothetical protein